MKLPFVVFVFVFVSIAIFQVEIDVVLASNRIPFLVNPQSLEGHRYITVIGDTIENPKLFEKFVFRSRVGKERKGK